jgi:hypothetical protein
MDPVLEKLMDHAPKLIAAAGKNHRTLSALGILAVVVVAVIYFQTHPGVSQTVGSDSVVMGQVSPNARIGDRSVVIGATDAHGNTILTQPMVVGHNAHGGPNSIMIGADAGGGQTAVPPTPQGDIQQTPR